MSRGVGGEIIPAPAAADRDLLQQLVLRISRLRQSRQRAENSDDENREPKVLGSLHGAFVGAFAQCTKLARVPSTRTSDRRHLAVMFDEYYHDLTSGRSGRISGSVCAGGNDAD